METEKQNTSSVPSGPDQRLLTVIIAILRAELTLCGDSYSVSISSLCYCSGTWKSLAILPKVQVAGYT